VQAKGRQAGRRVQAGRQVAGVRQAGSSSKGTGRHVCVAGRQNVWCGTGVWQAVGSVQW